MIWGSTAKVTALYLNNANDDPKPPSEQEVESDYGNAEAMGEDADIPRESRRRAKAQRAKEPLHKNLGWEALQNLCTCDAKSYGKYFQAK